MQPLRPSAHQAVIRTSLSCVDRQTESRGWLSPLHLGQWSLESQAGVSGFESRSFQLYFKVSSSGGKWELDEYTVGVPMGPYFCFRKNSTVICFITWNVLGQRFEAKKEFKVLCIFTPLYLSKLFKLLETLLQTKDNHTTNFIEWQEKWYKVKWAHHQE